MKKIGWCRSVNSSIDTHHLFTQTGKICAFIPLPAFGDPFSWLENLPQKMRDKKRLDWIGFDKNFIGIFPKFGSVRIYAISFIHSMNSFSETMLTFRSTFFMYLEAFEQHSLHLLSIYSWKTNLKIQNELQMNRLILKFTTKNVQLT